MSQTLQLIREKYPQYKDKTDQQLIEKIGSKYPQYLQRDPEFQKEFEAVNFGLGVAEALKNPTPAKRSYLGETGASTSRAAITGVGDLLKGAAAVQETMPITGVSFYNPPAWARPATDPTAIQQQRRTELLSKPAELISTIQKNPLFVTGQAITEVAPEVYPPDIKRRGQLGPKVGEMAGSFLPLIASGPFAPATIGLQSMGSHLDLDFQQAKAEGLSDEEAAERALGRGMASGALQSSVFLALPKPLRAAGEKYLINRFGKDTVGRFLAGRVALGAEGAVLGATSHLGENVIGDRPLSEGLGESATALGAMQSLMPPYRLPKRIVQPPLPQSPLMLGPGAIPLPTSPLAKPVAPVVPTTPPALRTILESPPTGISEAELAARDLRDAGIERLQAQKRPSQATPPIIGEPPAQPQTGPVSAKLALLSVRTEMLRRRLAAHQDAFEKASKANDSVGMRENQKAIIDIGNELYPTMRERERLGAPLELESDYPLTGDQMGLRGPIRRPFVPEFSETKPDPIQQSGGLGVRGPSFGEETRLPTVYRPKRGTPLKTKEEAALARKEAAAAQAVATEVVPVGKTKRESKPEEKALEPEPLADELESAEGRAAVPTEVKTDSPIVADLRTVLSVMDTEMPLMSNVERKVMEAQLKERMEFMAQEGVQIPADLVERAKRYSSVPEAESPWDVEQKLTSHIAVRKATPFTTSLLRLPQGSYVTFENDPAKPKAWLATIYEPIGKPGEGSSLGKKEELRGAYLKSLMRDVNDKYGLDFSAVKPFGETIQPELSNEVKQELIRRGLDLVRKMTGEPAIKKKGYIKPMYDQLEAYANKVGVALNEPLGPYSQRDYETQALKFRDQIRKLYGEQPTAEARGEEFPTYSGSPRTAKEVGQRPPGSIDLAKLTDNVIEELILNPPFKNRMHDVGVRYGLSKTYPGILEEMARIKEEAAGAFKAAYDIDKASSPETRRQAIAAQARQTWAEGVIEGARRQGPNYEAYLDEVKRGKAPAEEGTTPEKGIIAGSELEKWADEQIKEGGERMFTGVDPELMLAYAVKGAAIIERGVRNFADWSREMVKQFGEGIRPQLKNIYNQAVQKWQEAIEKGEKVEKSGSQRVRSDELPIPRKFQILIGDNPVEVVISKNAKPGELPYRVTLFEEGYPTLGHNDFTEAQVRGINEHKSLDWLAEMKGGKTHPLLTAEELSRTKLVARTEQSPIATTPPVTEAKPAKEGGERMFSGVDPGPISRFIEQDVAPGLKKGVDGTKSGIKTLVDLFTPATRTPKRLVDILFESKGFKEKIITQAAGAMEEMKKQFDAMPSRDQVTFIDRVKRGVKQPTKELQLVADTLRQWDDRLYDEIIKYKPGLPYLENHLRVLWKTIPGSPESMKGLSKEQVASKKPWRGTQGFTRRHVLEDISEGIAMGGVPVTTNPVEMFLLHAQDAMKFVAANRAWKGLKEVGEVTFVRQGKTPPPGYTRINDSISKAYFRTEEGATATAGEWYVQEGAARMINNYLSRDLIRGNSIGRGLMAMKNATTAIELGMSPFHAVFVTNEMMASSIGLGIAKMLELKDEGLRDFQKAFTVEAAPLLGVARDVAQSLVVGPLTGGKLKLPAMNPMKGSTANIGRAAIMYAKNAEQFKQSNPELYKWFTEMYPEAPRLLDDLFLGGGQVEMNMDYRNAYHSMRDAWKNDNQIGAVVRVIPALNDIAMKPLFETYIPRLKVGMFLREYSFELGRRTDDLASGKLTRAELARKTWSFIEDRFGEQNYDNLYWNRTFKSALQLAFRSVTWKLGNANAWGKAFYGMATEAAAAAKKPAGKAISNLAAKKIFDKKRNDALAELGKRWFEEGRNPRLTLPMAWLIGISVITAFQATIITKGATGKWPWELADDEEELARNLVFPRIDPVDKSQRVSIPTYWRDAVHAVHSIPDYIKSSLTGEWGRLADVWENRDFYGTEVYHEDDPLLKRTYDKFTHLVPLPFGLSSYVAAHRTGATGPRAAAGFMGFTKAPYYISYTPAEKEAYKFIREQQPIGGRTEQEFERGVNERIAVDAIKRKEMTLSEAIKKGMVDRRRVDIVGRRLSQTPLQHAVKSLKSDGAFQVWLKASAAERKDITGLVKIKIANSQTLTSAEKKSYFDQMKAAESKSE